MPSTFTSGYVQDNEIVKTEDIQFGFESIIDNATKMASMILESTQDFVINGKVKSAGGMKLVVSPIFGVCHLTGKAFGCTTESPCTTDGSISYLTIAQGGNLDRIDTIEVRSEWQTYDTQQRAFRDLDTKTDTVQQTDTKQHLNIVYRVLAGEDGSSLAPAVESGWVKLAEVFVPANTEELTDSNIRNITADIEGEENTNWTNEKSATYNIGYISDVNQRFRRDHNEDGSHKENVISLNELNVGVGSKQINATVLPLGAIINFANKSTEITESIKSVFAKFALVITDFYNYYLKQQAYNFKGAVSISDEVTEENSLVKPFIIKVETNDKENKIVNFYLNERKIFSIAENGVLRTAESYSATTSYDLVTKSITDAIQQTVINLTNRIKNIEETSDVTVYSNNTLSRFSVDNNVTITAATETNIEFTGLQIIDGVSVSPGDVILVKSQTDATENGLYEVSSSTWSRKAEYMTTQNIKEKIWSIKNGTKNKGKMYYCPKVNFQNADFGIDEISFSEYFSSSSPLPNKGVIRDPNGNVKSQPAKENSDCLIKADLLNLIYPVGSLYWSSKSTNPSELFGGTWVQIKDKFVLAAGDTYKVDTTGGSATVKLTESNLPAHSHKFTPSGTISGGSYSFKGTSVKTDSQGSHAHTTNSTINTANTTAKSLTGSVGTVGSSQVFTNQQGIFTISESSSKNALNDVSSATALNSKTLSIDATHRHGTDSQGSHDHSVTASGTVSVTTNPTFSGTEGTTGNGSGTGSSLNIMPPYIVKYCFERIA